MKEKGRQEIKTIWKEKAIEEERKRGRKDGRWKILPESNNVIFRR